MIEIRDGSAIERGKRRRTSENVRALVINMKAQEGTVIALENEITEAKIRRETERETTRREDIVIGLCLVTVDGDDPAYYHLGFQPNSASCPSY